MIKADSRNKEKQTVTTMTKLSGLQIPSLVLLLVFLGVVPHAKASSCDGSIPQGPKWGQLRDYLAGRGNSPGALPLGPQWQHVPGCVEVERKRRVKARCKEVIPQGPKWQSVREYLAGRGDSPGVLPRGPKWQHLPQCVQDEQRRRERSSRYR
jgi:hypothetical protein